MTEYPCHKEQLTRLNRALGQLEAVKQMIKEGKYCVDIMTQLRAVRSAIKAIELNVLEAHMGSCVASAACAKNKKLKKMRIAELMKLLKKYE